jgi:hypothetical protein
MPTEEYNSWKPWVCPGCSAELQFSKAQGSIMQLYFFGIALLLLYLVGVRGWQLAVGTVLLGFALAFVLSGPLTRILPPRLEPFAPPPWKKDKETDKFVEDGLMTLFPHERAGSDKPKQADQSEEDMPRDS